MSDKVVSISHVKHKKITEELKLKIINCIDECYMTLHEQGCESSTDYLELDVIYGLLIMNFSRNITGRINDEKAFRRKIFNLLSFVPAESEKLIKILNNRSELGF